MEQMLKDLVLEILKEINTVGGGNIRGVTLPLGMSPPDHTSSDSIIIKKAKKKPTKSSKKSNKDYLNKSPSFYIKNGPAKKRKRDFK